MSRLSGYYDGKQLLLIDLHVHTYPKSDDAFMGVDELIEAAKAKGLDGICLTEHDAFWTADEGASLSRRHDFLILPGTEINTDTGHVLVFGLDRYVFGLHKPDFLRTAVAERGAVVIAAHPYRRRFLEEPAKEPAARVEMLEQAKTDKLFEFCDAIEGLNGRGSAAENDFSHDLGKLLGAKTTAGSDAHRVEQLGTAATRFQRWIAGLDDLIRELREGRFEAVDLRVDTGQDSDA